MAKINIKIAEVEKIAENMQQLNRKLAQTLNNTKEAMLSLHNSWHSSGAEEIRQRFIAFSSRFDEEFRVVESYVNFLKRTSETYQSLESTIVNNAQNF